MRRSLKIIIISFTFNVLSFFSYGQYIESLDTSLIKDEGLVDENLKFDKSPGFLPVNSERLPVIYYELIKKEEILKDRYGSYTLELPPMTHPKTGVKTKGRLYKNPNLYYAIIDLPKNTGRFYGAITCGYDPIEAVMTESKSSWNPYTEVYLLAGEVVKPDGTREKFRHTDNINNRKIKPGGKYWALDVLGYDDIEFQFNQNGTGTITAYQNRHAWTLLRVGARSYTIRQNGRNVRKRNTSGGYKVWMRPIAKRSFKWTINDNGDAVIIPYGDASPTLEEGIEPTESEELNRERRNDFLTNEESIYFRNMYKKQAKKNLEAFDEIIITPETVAKDLMIGKISGTVSFKTSVTESMSPNADEWRAIVNYQDDQFTNKMMEDLYPKVMFFGRKRPKIHEMKSVENVFTIMDLDLIYFPILDEIAQSTQRKRTKSRPKEYEYYDRMVSEIKSAINKNPSVFDNTESYKVEKINPNEHTATVTFIVPNKVYEVKIEFNEENNSINMKSMETSKKAIDGFGGVKDEAISLNVQIMEFKGNKKCKKIISKYEKEYINRYPGNKSFHTFEELDSITQELKRFISYQKSVLDSIRDKI